MHDTKQLEPIEFEPVQARASHHTFGIDLDIDTTMCIILILIVVRLLFF